MTGEGGGNLKLIIEYQGSALLEERHIGEEEILQIIHEAEANGKKFYIPTTDF